MAGDELSTAKELPAEAERELAARSALYRAIVRVGPRRLEGAAGPLENLREVLLEGV